MRHAARATFVGPFAKLIQMTYCRFATILFGSATLVFSQTPANWKTIHDKSGACQISVPADWTVSKDLPNTASAPADNGDVQLMSRPGKTLKPMSDMAQKALMVDKMIQNTPQGVLFTNKPTQSDRPITPYNATAPGNNGTCVALISARSAVSEDTVKRMFATLSASH